MSRNWQTGVATHQGMKKNRNEDSHLHRITNDSKGKEIALFVVADGMGGYQVGDEASRIAITSIQKWWDKRILKLMKKKEPMQHIVKEAKTLLLQINKQIIVTGKHIGKKMGTTASLLILYHGSYAVIHIGDSRIYRMKDWSYGLQQYFHESKDANRLQKLIEDEQTELLEANPELVKLTEDHSWVAKQVVEGKLTEEQARTHPKRNALTQCLGLEEHIEPFNRIGTYDSSDLFLVCSDGFHSLFSNDEIKNMLVNLEKEYVNLQSICEYLINFSNFSQAKDNVTLMLVRNPYIANTVPSKKNAFLSFLKR